jgi:outer membrane protein OmpA-like peptidoglycan-associated protein
MVGRSFDQLRAAIDAGVMFRRRTILSPDANVQDEIGHALRLGATLSSLGEGLRGEVAVLGSVPLKREGSSVEALAGARWPMSEAFEVYGLAGFGFGTAPGTPDFRVLLGVAFERPRPPAQAEVAKFEPAPPPLDSDGDSVLDDMDRCPTVPGLMGLQGCPDQDGDGMEDGVDRCAGEAGPVDRQGCPERDSDGDGLLDGKDSCPTQVGPIDRGGCPVPDRDRDTVEDLRDNCPDVAGPPDNQGCPPEEKQLVVIQKDRIEIKDTIHFNFNKATIQRRSYGLLDQVARVLVEHPEIVLVSIEGHTDDWGSAQYNRGLSQRRAEAVRDYFVRKGVAPDRMQARGFGEDVPVQSNATQAGRAANRRVEFITRYEQQGP